MEISLIQARQVKIGDLIEHPNLHVYRPVAAIDKQFGRLYFLFNDNQPMTALIDDLVMMGRINE